MNQADQTAPEANQDTGESGGEPIRTIVRDGVEYTILGTAHVSRTSAETVGRLIDEGAFDSVAVELCPSRHAALTDREAWKKMDLFRIIRERKAGMMMASLALGAYQRRIAEQFGIEPGAEMRTAIEGCQTRDLNLQLIDREIGVTMRRASRRLSLWNRWVLTTGIVLSLFSREKVSEEDIERLKQGDMLTETFREFAESSPALFETLIAERDHYMAARLRRENRDAAGSKVLVVIGAGHMEGLAEALENGGEDPAEAAERLEVMPPPSRVVKAIPWIIAALVLSGFGIGFYRSPELGWALVATWVVINGTLSALGALLARAHPLTVLSALVAAPLTSLNPTIGAGMVTALVECWLRKPKMADFENLREDVARLRGWWNNNVARVFLVFFLSNLGSAAGTWVAGFRMFAQLTA